ncbi:MAG: TIGR04086 family membrane protein [Acutalibacteraceae bacterium]|jgi:putative membrane protein (TIGR04086 family)
MHNELKRKIDIKMFVSCAILQIIVTTVFIAIFAAIMYFFETDYKYSPVFGVVSVAAGALACAYFLSAKKKCKGYMYGFIVGSITFIIVTIVSLIINDGGITVNTLFHLVIILLSSMTGGILGVNKKQNKYI